MVYDGGGQCCGERRGVQELCCGCWCVGLHDETRELLRQSFANTELTIVWYLIADVE